MRILTMMRPGFVRGLPPASSIRNGIAIEIAEVVLVAVVVFLG